MPITREKHMENLLSVDIDGLLEEKGLNENSVNDVHENYSQVVLSTLSLEEPDYEDVERYLHKEFNMDMDDLRKKEYNVGKREEAELEGIREYAKANKMI